MKLRDILILAGLIVLILGLTIAEQYAVRRRELRKEQEQEAALREWQGRMAAAFESRWTTLSSGLHQTLDSIAQEVLATGISHDSLVAIMAQPQSASPMAESASAAPQEPAAKSDTLSTRDLAKEVLQEYEKALRALPHDLNAYEKRVATNEVASLVRAKFGLSASRFDQLLKTAAAQP
jgi:hypothetical protein